MTPSIRSSLVALLLLTPATVVSAQDAEPHQGWTVGTGVLIADRAYAGQGSDVTPFPLITYSGERWFHYGLGGGFHLINHSKLQLDAHLGVRIDGFKTDDLSRAELARNGIDRDLLSDRDPAADAGITATWRGSAGVARASAKADITDTSGGYELLVDYGYPIPIGRGRLTPRIGVTHYSADMANYYFGTLPEEQERGVVVYEPESATFVQAGVNYVYPIGERWTLSSAINYRQLPTTVKESPLIEQGKSGSVSVMLGVSYRFGTP